MQNGFIQTLIHKCQCITIVNKIQLFFAAPIWTPTAWAAQNKDFQPWKCRKSPRATLLLSSKAAFDDTLQSDIFISLSSNNVSGATNLPIINHSELSLRSVFTLPQSPCRTVRYFPITLFINSVTIALGLHCTCEHLKGRFWPLFNQGKKSIKAG